MSNDFKWNGEEYSSANGIQTSVGERLTESIQFLPDMSVPDAGCGTALWKVFCEGNKTLTGTSAHACGKQTNCLKRRCLKLHDMRSQGEMICAGCVSAEAESDRYIVADRAAEDE